MPWKNSWFQLSVLVAVISGGLLIADFGPTAYSFLVAAKFMPSSPTSAPSTPTSLPSTPPSTQTSASTPLSTPTSSPSAPIPPVTTPPTSTPTPITPPNATPLSLVGPVAGQPWTNSLGMKFVPAGIDSVLFCIWDVRVQDFRTYVQATGYQMLGGISVMKAKSDIMFGDSISWKLDPKRSWEQPGFEQGATQPVVGISWMDAIAFCEWLTKKERAEGKLGGHQMYRLPRDAEWSIAVGDRKYPWGDIWPPPANAGNYGDQAFASSLEGSGWSSLCLPENDGYSRTSPVGSFPANAYGLYDIGGNVWQWCMDWYQASMNRDEILRQFQFLRYDGGGTAWKVLRGASWDSDIPNHLISSFRFFDSPSGRTAHYGFRVVVVVSP